MEVSSTDKKAPTGVVEEESVKKVEEPAQKSGVVQEVDSDQKKSNKAPEKEEGGATGESVEDPSLQGVPTATDAADILPFRRSVFGTDSSLE